MELSDSVNCCYSCKGCQGVPTDPEVSGCELDFPSKGAAQIRWNWQFFADVKIGFSFSIRLLTVNEELLVACSSGFHLH